MTPESTIPYDCPATGSIEDRRAVGAGWIGWTLTPRGRRRISRPYKGSSAIRSRWPQVGAEQPDARLFGAAGADNAWHGPVPNAVGVVIDFPPCWCKLAGPSASARCIACRGRDPLLDGLHHAGLERLRLRDGNCDAEVCSGHAACSSRGQPVPAGESQGIGSNGYAVGFTFANSICDDPASSQFSAARNSSHGMA